MPYGNLVATDTAKQLMEMAVQVLIILLDYGYPIKPPATSTEPPSPGPQSVIYISADDTEAQGFNIFRKLLSSIDAPDQLNFIFRGFSRLLNNAHKSESSYLPYSVTRIGVEQVILFSCELSCLSFTWVLHMTHRNFWFCSGSVLKRSRSLCRIS